MFVDPNLLSGKPVKDRKFSFTTGIVLSTLNYIECFISILLVSKYNYYSRYKKMWHECQ